MRCIDNSALRYGLTAPIVLSILSTEGGRPGTVAPDPNGTYDLGPAQVNTCHLPFLSQYGYSFATLRDDACANVAAGAWIFSRCLFATGNVLEAAACYNAGSRPWLAWQSGYFQRFASFLGVALHDPQAFLDAAPAQKPKPSAPILLDDYVHISKTGGLL
jgi:hypothetical protein